MKGIPPVMFNTCVYSLLHYNFFKFLSMSNSNITCNYTVGPQILQISLFQQVLNMYGTLLIFGVLWACVEIGSMFDRKLDPSIGKYLTVLISN